MRSWAVRSAAVGLLAFLLGCGGSADPPLRVALSQWPSYELFRLASVADSSLSHANIRLVDFYSPLDALQAYELGLVDVLCCTLGEVLQIQDNGERNPVVLYVIDASEGADMLLAPDSLTTLSGLRGLRVGVEPGTVGEILLASVLEQAGLGPADIQRVPFHLQLQRGPLAESGLDAVVCFPPFSTRLLGHGGLATIYESSQLPNALLDVMVVEHELLEERRDELAALVRGHQQAIALRRERADWADSLMAAWERVDVADFRSSFAGIRLFPLEEQLGLLRDVLPKTSTATRRLLSSQGRLSAQAPPTQVSTASVAEAGNEP